MVGFLFGFEQVEELAKRCVQQDLLHSCPPWHVGVAPKSMFLEGVELVLLSSLDDGRVEGSGGGKCGRGGDGR
jgi:hypothetical protein